MVQWLGFCVLTAKGLGSIPGWGTKIPQATWCGQKGKKRKALKGPSPTASQSQEWDLSRISQRYLEIGITWGICSKFRFAGPMVTPYGKVSHLMCSLHIFNGRLVFLPIFDSSNTYHSALLRTGIYQVQAINLILLPDKVSVKVSMNWLLNFDRW